MPSDLRRSLCALAASLFMLQQGAPLAAEPPVTYPGRALVVIDGDTIEATVAGRAARLRLYGVDAPELAQDHGDEARTELRRLVEDKELRIGAIDVDRYGRLLALVEANGRDSNEAMLTSGYAWAYRTYLDAADAERFCQAEASARDAHRGLWRDEPRFWDAPWDYRERQRDPARKRVERGNESMASCRAASHAQAEIEQRRARIGAWFAELPSPGCLIKGNVNTAGARIYHLPGTSGYQATHIDQARGERWFCDEREAQQAGFRRAR